MNVQSRTRRRKTDRRIERAWRLTLGLMIMGVAIASVLVAYSAFFAAIGKQWTGASIYLVIAGALGWGTTWLCYNRNDLAGAV